MRALGRRVWSALGICLLSLVLSIGDAVAVASTPPPASPTPSTGNDPPSSPPPGSPTASAGGTSLTTAQIVAKWEPSVARIKGYGSSGTGFLVKPGIVATNAHVIGEEFISALEVRFPSAAAGQQGPLPAELLYEDPQRDLAFLRVATSLPAIEVAPSYTFVKGEDITVIGNPVLGDEVVLESAISRGVMSSKSVLQGRNYFQISMAINPGNSGGPVFDSAGRVIGVATLKATRAEAMAFSIPVEDLHAAMARVGPSYPEVSSRHRAQVAFKLLTVAGGLYGVGLDTRAALLREAPPGSGQPNLLPNEPVQRLDKLLSQLEEKRFSPLEAEVANIRDDAGLTKETRDRYQELAAGYKAMRELYADTNRPAAQYTARVRELRANYLRQVEALQKDLKIEVPSQLLALLKQTVNATRPQLGITPIVPAPLPSRVLHGPRLQPRGAIGPGSTPGQSSRDRMRGREAADPTLDTGVDLFHRGQYKEAYAVFRKLLQSQADDARAWYYAALSYGLATGDWDRTTRTMAEEGLAREKANQPPKAEIDAVFAGLTKETGKDWLDFYRRRAR